MAPNARHAHITPSKQEYNQILSNDEHEPSSDVLMAREGGGEEAASSSGSEQAAKRIESAFRWMSILFAANHASVVSCLSLATARFAATGAWQSGILYAFYTGSALFGATWAVKQLGSRNALVAGMSLYCFYVLAFLLATLIPSQERTLAYTGAAIGGLGAGFLWTAQGSYFSLAAEKHAAALGHSLEDSTNKFGAIFAFYYLLEEVLLRALSSLSGAIQGIDWTVIFTIYVMVAVVSTVGMLGVRKFDAPVSDSVAQSESWLHRSTAALQLLRNDSKMKYMIGLNAAFGFSSAFLSSYVNGEVVDAVFERSNMVGVLTSWLSIVATFMSVVFERVANSYSKGLVLIIGSVCFACVALPFVLFPSVESWGPMLLVLVYTAQGSGRATFESTLKAVFADFFSYEKEGAFANIILQNGSASALGFALSFGLKCQTEGGYCVRFRDGSLHDVLSYESLVIGTSIVAILGFLQAHRLQRYETLATSSDDEEEEEQHESPLV